MFYFTILDATTFFSLLIFASCLSFLVILYTLPFKKESLWIRISTLWINSICLVILLFFLVFSYLVNYEFETLFNAQKDHMNSIILIIAINATFLVLTIIFMIYVFAFNYLFVVYADEKQTYAGAWKNKKYLIKKNKLVNLKTKKDVNPKQWIVKNKKV